MKNRILFLSLALSFLIFMIAVPCFARDFGSAANTFYDQAKQMRPAICGAGILVGVFILAISSSARFLMTAIIATIAAYSPSAILGLCQMVFGTS